MKKPGVFARMRASFAPKEGKKEHRIAAFVFLTVVYAIVLGVGLLAVFLLGEALFVRDTILSNVSSFYVVVFPTYLIYLFVHRPFGWPKGLYIFFLIVGLLANIGLAAWFFMNSRNIFFLAVTLISEIGLLVGYLALARNVTKLCVIVGLCFTLLAPCIAALLLIVYVLYFIFFIAKGGVGVIKEGMKDDPTVKGFVAGYRGEPIPYKYSAEVINEMGVREKLYSDDKMSWFTESGNYRGQSNDGGETIQFK